MTNQNQRISTLQQVPLLSVLSRANLGTLARRAEEVEVPAGAFLTREGALGAEVYVVLDGSFTVRRNSRKVAARTKGDVFGEMSLVDGMPRRADVVADKDSIVLVVHKRDLDPLLENPRVAGRILQNLAARLKTADKEILG
ncbi:MAG: cyclic nucleotide-binding domain-containing protein [Acidimicrobiia bacterium]|nr:cyclic nucleotide-binding domain-containing protein [Acidimicrobiia bacterium]